MARNDLSVFPTAMTARGTFVSKAIGVQRHKSLNKQARQHKAKTERGARRIAEDHTQVAQGFGGTARCSHRSP